MSFTKEERELACALTYSCIQCLRSFHYEILLDAKPSLFSQTLTIPTILQISNTLTNEIVFNQSMIDYTDDNIIKRKQSTSIKHQQNVKRRFRTNKQIEAMLKIIEELLDCTFIYPLSRFKSNGLEYKKWPNEIKYSIELKKKKKHSNITENKIECQHSIDMFLNVFYQPNEMSDEIFSFSKQSEEKIKTIVLGPIDYFAINDIDINKFLKN